jgi:hypothetical protein
MLLLFKLFGELLEERPSLSCEIPETGDDDDASDAVYDDRLRIGVGWTKFSSWNDKSFDGDILFSHICTQTHTHLRLLSLSS